MPKSKEEKAHTAKRQQIAKSLLSISLMVKKPKVNNSRYNCPFKAGGGGGGWTSKGCGIGAAGGFESLIYVQCTERTLSHQARGVCMVGLNLSLSVILLRKGVCMVGLNLFLSVILLRKGFAW